MTYEELLERLVDPASAGHGGHGPMVELLNSNDQARVTAKAFGAIERLYKPDAAAAPPKDFDFRVLGRLAEAEVRGGPARKVSPLVFAAVAVAVLAIAFFALRKGPAPAPTAVAERPTPRAAQPTATAAPSVERAPDILAVRSTPISLEIVDLSPEETEAVKAMFDASFLKAVDTLAQLDPLFADDLVPPETAGPVLPRQPSPAVRSAESEAELNARLLDYRRQPKAERDRLNALDAAYKARPEEQRLTLLRRWEAIKAFSPEELAGLRRLIARFGDLDAKKLGKLKQDIRSIALGPVEARRPRWQVLPFAKGLTGQESYVVEKLIGAR